MNILVTGGAGYIGSHTCAVLLSCGCGVTVLDNLCNASAESLRRVRALTGRDLAFYEGDARDEALLARIFREQAIDCVIHFAGLKAVGESVQKPWEYYDNNLRSTLALTRAMDAAGCRRIIFSSSATVYEPGSPMPLRESSPTGHCSSPYGWTKYMTEQILAGIAHADARWSVCLLRYFNPVGAHESGTIGEDPRGVPNNLMPFITQVAVGKREKLSVFGSDYPTPDGTCVRDYIHVMDLAEGHAAAVDYTVSHTGCEAFNLGTGNGVSVLELVQTFSRVNGVRVPYVLAPRRAGDVAVCYADPSKSNAALGWQAKRTIADMCRDAWAWQSANPAGYGA